MRNLPAERNSELWTPSLKSIPGHRLEGALVAFQDPHNPPFEGILAWPRVINFQVLFLTAYIIRPTWNFHSVVLATWDEEGIFTREEKKWEGETETEKEVRWVLCLQSGELTRNATWSREKCLRQESKSIEMKGPMCQRVAGIVCIRRGHAGDWRYPGNPASAQRGVGFRNRVTEVNGRGRGYDHTEQMLIYFFYLPNRIEA